MPTSNRKPWLKMGLFLIVVGLLAVGVLRALESRKQQQAALNASSETAAALALELEAGDLLEVQTRTLARTLAISGPLRAVNSAVVKARVAGELQELSLREGDTVKAGQVVARIEDYEYQRRVRQAREQAEAAKAQVDIAKRQFENNRALVDQGFISRTALDTSQASLQGALATHQAALTGVEIAQKSLDDTRLLAPISGQVALRAAQPGERVGLDAKVLEIVDLSQLELEAALSPADSVDVRLGQQATLSIEGRDQPVRARVVRLNPNAQTGSRSVLVYLSLASSQGLRQGLFAQGQLALGQASGMALPLTAVRTDKPEPYVQLVQDGLVLHKPVTLGARAEREGQTEVLVLGLKNGQRVLRGELGSLREGTRVKLPAAPAAPAAPVSTPRS